MGLLWHDDWLYVTSTGRVDAYRGFDGTRFTEQRTVLTLEGTGLGGGIVITPDGRLLTGISAPCDHCTPSSQWAAAVVSFRPDGSDVQVYASGIRAPVGLARYPGTSVVFVTMNQRDDLAAQTPGDWLAVVEQGDGWGFPDCYGQETDPCSEMPEPTAVLDEHAAASGVAITTGELGEAVGTAALVAEWAEGKVLGVALDREGSTYVGTTAPFLTGLEHPVPVLLAPDGALLVGDWGTGTVYRITTAS
jgi:glucose/arabinose dehydrogenase